MAEKIFDAEFKIQFKLPSSDFSRNLNRFKF